MLEAERLPIPQNVSSSSGFPNDYPFCHSANIFYGSPALAGQIYFPAFPNNPREANLSSFLLMENPFNANIYGLLSVNPARDDRADASMRDDSLRRLLSLHRACFGLTSYSFCRAAYLVDVFITRVKVKPRYMMILTMACYYVAAKFDKYKEKAPTMEQLVRMADCGGTSDDLLKMVQIIVTKLGTAAIGTVGAKSSTPLDFLCAFLSDTEEKVENINLPTFLIREVENALCSTTSARFRPACLALALLMSCKQVCPPPSRSETEGLKILERLEHVDLRLYAAYCNVSWDEVRECSLTLYASGVLESYSPTKSSVPLSRVMWCLNKRKQNSVSISVPPKLKTIRENHAEEEDEE